MTDASGAHAKHDVLDALGEAIEAVLSKAGEFPTRWVLIAEAVGPDNQRGLWISASRDAKPWDTLGMMQHAMHIEQAATVWADRPEG